MIIQRKNSTVSATDAAATADACFEAMERHTRRTDAPGGPPSGPPKPPPPAGATASAPADIIYGARAIAEFIFGDSSNKARRRVFNLWTHYSQRQERAGFFKLKGALCLSKKQWQAFHGL